MKKGAGRLKGAGFEIGISRILSSWVLEESLGKRCSIDIFWRSTSSGGKAAIERKAGRSSKVDGDIMSVDQRGEFFTDSIFIECKNYKSFDIFSSFMLKKGAIWEWWTKGCKQSDDANKLLVLIVKANNQPVYCLFPGSFQTELEDYFGHMIIDHWEFYTGGKSVVCCKLLEFLSWVEAKGLAVCLANML